MLLAVGLQLGPSRGVSRPGTATKRCQVGGGEKEAGMAARLIPPARLWRGRASARDGRFLHAASSSVGH